MNEIAVLMEALQLWQDDLEFGKISSGNNAVDIIARAIKTAEARGAQQAGDQRMPAVCWVRLARFCQRYDCRHTTAYAWLADGRVYSRKIGGLRLWQVGTVRGVDNDEPPENAWAVPAAARPENAGRRWPGRTRQSAKLTEESLQKDRL